MGTYYKYINTYNKWFIKFHHTFWTLNTAFILVQNVKQFPGHNFTFDSELLQFGVNSVLSFPIKTSFSVLFENAVFVSSFQLKWHGQCPLAKIFCSYIGYPYLSFRMKRQLWLIHYVNVDVRGYLYSAYTHEHV